MVFPFLNMLTGTMYIPMEINVCKMNNHIFSPQNNTIGQITLISLELLRSGGMCFGAKGAEKNAAMERGKYSFAEMKFMSSVVFLALRNLFCFIGEGLQIFDYII
jgi:hypothetical protein